MTEDERAYVAALERQIVTLTMLLKGTAPAVRQWCAEYSIAEADRHLLQYIEALPDADS